jgi:hypothetical protein
MGKRTAIFAKIGQRGSIACFAHRLKPTVNKVSSLRNFSFLFRIEFIILKIFTVYLYHILLNVFYVFEVVLETTKKAGYLTISRLRGIWRNLYKEISQVHAFYVNIQLFFLCTF